MKKKLLAMVALILALLMLAACGGNAASNGGSDSKQPEVASGEWKWERKITLVCPWGVGGGADGTLRPLQPVAKLVHSINIIASSKKAITFSFHHHLRDGDYVVNMVMAVAIEELGLGDLTIAASSLDSAHDPIADYIEQGKVTGIQTSGIRGRMGEVVSAGKLKTPAIIRSHGGRPRAIEAGEVHIDIDFIAAPTSDCIGNCRGIGGKSDCGSMGYAMTDDKYAERNMSMAYSVCAVPAYDRRTREQVVSLLASEGLREDCGPMQGFHRMWTCFWRNAATSLCLPSGKPWEALQPATPLPPENKAYLRYGARGEAASGFPNIRNIALPALKAALASGKSLEQAGVYALLHLITVVEDTNLIARGGSEGQKWAVQYAANLLA